MDENAEGGSAGSNGQGEQKGPAPEDFRQLYFEARKSAEEYLTRLKYMQADFENFRKRTAKERMETVLFANEELMGELLPMLDELEAAIQKMGAGSDKDGVRMIHAKFLGMLKGNGLQEIKVQEGAEFDPECHEAIGKEKTEDAKLAGKVARVLQKGYALNGKVLRFAKVAVHAEESGANGK